SLPKVQTADTGMDVLTHCLEAYVSNMASDFTDGLAEKGAELVVQNLIEAYQHPDNAIAREHMHNASTIAGMAFTNAFLGINHSLAHKIGAEFHIAHGRTNAILLPYVIRYNASMPTKFVSFPKYESFIADKKYATMAWKLGLRGNTVEEAVDNLIRLVEDMNKELGIESSFQEYGISEKEFLSKLDSLADKAFEDQCTTANPRMPLVRELKQIMLDAYYGNKESRE
ncbi:MAG: iron-containing alcohol dehydrogenase, partial [Bacilli bacterium]|nr:iron-containing alcohol dehydrogenase [Bacilli bacterium]